MARHPLQRGVGDHQVDPAGGRQVAHVRRHPLDPAGRVRLRRAGEHLRRGVHPHHPGLRPPRREADVSSPGPQPRSTTRAGPVAPTGEQVDERPAALAGEAEVRRRVPGAGDVRRLLVRCHRSRTLIAGIPLLSRVEMCWGRWHRPTVMPPRDSFLTPTEESDSVDPTPPPRTRWTHSRPSGPHRRSTGCRPPVSRAAAEAPVDGGMGAVGLVAKLRAVLRRARLPPALAVAVAVQLRRLARPARDHRAAPTSLVNGFAAAELRPRRCAALPAAPGDRAGPVAGVFADRFDRRMTMVICDVLRFGLFPSIPLVDNLIWLFVAQFLIEAFSLFWIPAKEAAVPNLVRKDQLETANQLTLITTYGSPRSLAAIVFAVLTTRRRPAVGRHPRRRPGRPRAVPQRADVPGRRARHLEPAVDQRPAAAGRGRPAGAFFGSLKHGFTFAGHTPLVRGLVVGILGAFAAAGVVIATGQAFATALGGGDAAYGLLFGAVFVGLGLGIAFGPSIARDLSRRAALRRRDRRRRRLVLLHGVDASRCGSRCCSSSSWASSPASPTWPASPCSAPRSTTRSAAAPSRSCSRWCGPR